MKKIDTMTYLITLFLFSGVSAIGSELSGIACHKKSVIKHQVVLEDLVVADFSANGKSSLNEEITIKYRRNDGEKTSSLENSFKVINFRSSGTGTSFKYSLENNSKNLGFIGFYKSLFEHNTSLDSIELWIEVDGKPIEFENCVIRLKH